MIQESLINDYLPSAFMALMEMSQATHRSSASQAPMKLSENSIWAECGNSSSPYQRMKRTERLPRMFSS